MEEEKILNLPAIILSAIGIITLTLAISFVYLSMNGKDYSNVYSKEMSSGEIKNSIQKNSLNASNEITKEENTSSQNKENFNLKTEQELIREVSVIFKFYNLHNIPFTAITPKIQFKLENKLYFVEISDGEIIIKEEGTDKKDIMIITDKEEISKIAENQEYATESISSGKTTIEKIAENTVLFSKGYLELDEQFR
jgi:hypothetical protein